MASSDEILPATNKVAAVQNLKSSAGKTARKSAKVAKTG